MWQVRFRDRAQAGRLLAERLKNFSGAPNAIVLALPRGGVPVAFEIAVALDLPLDVLVVRKLGVPTQPELAMGAIASGGGRYINPSVVAHAGITLDALVKASQREGIELQRQEKLFRGERAAINVTGKTVILVDDGVATGATIIAAVRALRSEKPKYILVAVPVAPPETVERLEMQADSVVCLDQPLDYMSVSSAYEDFAQVTDADVTALLERSQGVKIP